MTTVQILNELREVASAQRTAGQAQVADLLESASRHIGHPAVSVFVAFTDSGYWGKGKTLPEALKNAKAKSANRVGAYAASDDVTVYDSGRITASLLVDLGVIQEGKRLRFSSFK
ncbi:MAG: hypothetical protein ACO3EH_00370 [Ilumatobacteraceae bacterium]